MSYLIHLSLYFSFGGSNTFLVLAYICFQLLRHYPDFSIYLHYDICTEKNCSNVKKSSNINRHTGIFDKNRHMFTITVQRDDQKGTKNRFFDKINQIWFGTLSKYISEM